MTAWLPIESAPRDGTRVIVAKIDWCVGPFGMAGPEEYRVFFAITAVFNAQRDYWSDGLERLVDPTHWMPLPPPPSTEAHALPTRQQPDDMARAALVYADSVICVHENRHRGGAIWEICNDCGEKWADDEGGYVASPWPDLLKAALASLPAPKEESPLTELQRLGQEFDAADAKAGVGELIEGLLRTSRGRNMQMECVASPTMLIEAATTLQRLTDELDGAVKTIEEIALRLGSLHPYLPDQEFETLVTMRERGRDNMVDVLRSALNSIKEARGQ